MSGKQHSCEPYALQSYMGCSPFASSTKNVDRAGGLEPPLYMHTTISDGGSNAQALAEMTPEREWQHRVQALFRTTVSCSPTHPCHQQWHLLPDPQQAFREGPCLRTKGRLLQSVCRGVRHLVDGAILWFRRWVRSRSTAAQTQWPASCTAQAWTWALTQAPASRR